MIEKKILRQKMKESEIENHVFSFLGRMSCSSIKLQRTPLGEKVTIFTSKPGLIVGRKGANIKTLTYDLKHKFKMENPQIEVAEIENPSLDSSSVAKNIVELLNRFGPKRFKAVAYKSLENIMRSGAQGVEIVISGRSLPGVRAKTWRFSAGNLKKSGDISESFVDKAIESADIKSGTVGVQVRILKPDVILPDFVKVIEKDEQIQVEEVKEEKVVKKAKKKTAKKKVVKKEDVPVKEIKKEVQETEKTEASQEPVQVSVETKSEEVKEEQTEEKSNEQVKKE